MVYHNFQSMGSLRRVGCRCKCMRKAHAILCAHPITMRTEASSLRLHKVRNTSGARTSSCLCGAATFTPCDAWPQVPPEK